MLDIYVDADGCPVKEETYRVARRLGLTVFVVSNRPLRVPHESLIRAAVVSGAFDAADDWIVERVGPDDIVITADILLAERCIKAGAWVLTPKGQVHDEESIGNALASRELMDQLRQMGEISGGPAPFSKRDASNFLNQFDRIVQQIKRANATSP
jgi:uncharacterized protein YaiI (UPF0178 family)